MKAPSSSRLHEPFKSTEKHVEISRKILREFSAYHRTIFSNVSPFISSEKQNFLENRDETQIVLSKIKFPHFYKQLFSTQHFSVFLAKVLERLEDKPEKLGEQDSFESLMQLAVQDKNSYKQKIKDLTHKYFTHSSTLRKYLPAKLNSKQPAAAAHINSPVQTPQNSSSIRNLQNSNSLMDPTSNTNFCLSFCLESFCGIFLEL